MDGRRPAVHPTSWNGDQQQEEKVRCRAGGAAEIERGKKRNPHTKRQLKKILSQMLDLVSRHPTGWKRTKRVIPDQTSED